MTQKHLGGLIPAGLLLSSLIAVVSGGFILLEGTLITLLWQTIPQTLALAWPYQLLLCLVGGLLLATLKQHWGPLPATAHQAMAELRQTQTVRYQDTFKNLLVALVILAFGAGVGPEAALLGAIVSLSVWQADRLRYFYFHRDRLKTVSWYQRFWWLVKPTGHLQHYRSAQSVPAAQLGTKKRLYALFIVNGVVTFFILMRVIGHPSFITKMGASHWQFGELWVVIPALLLGAILGPLYQSGSRQLHRWGRLISGIWPRTLLGAAIIFGFAVLVPRLLFSGQTVMGLIPQISGNQNGYLLMMAAVLKLLFLQLCLGTGWIGGDIFPVVFASILFGFGCAQLLPIGDSVLLVATIATSLTTSLLGTTWLPGFFIALFFPWNLWPVLGLELVLQWGGRRLWAHYHPTPHN